MNKFDFTMIALLMILLMFLASVLTYNLAKRTAVKELCSIQNKIAVKSVDGYYCVDGTKAFKEVD